MDNNSGEPCNLAGDVIGAAYRACEGAIEEEATDVSHKDDGQLEAEWVRRFAGAGIVVASLAIAAGWALRANAGPADPQPGAPPPFAESAGVIMLAVAIIFGAWCVFTVVMETWVLFALRHRGPRATVTRS